MAANSKMTVDQLYTGIRNAATVLKDGADNRAIMTDAGGATAVLVEILITFDNRFHPEISYTARNTTKGAVKT